MAEAARGAGIEPLQPGRIGEVDAEISGCDALVVAAYGQILRSGTLEAAPWGAWNVHASLLPAYRGAAPVERAILAGEESTGVTIMRMTSGLDSGPYVMQREVPVSLETTGGELAEELASLGARAIVEALDLVERGAVELREQDESAASYAAKISAEERFVDWSRDARAVHDHIRALSPHVGARSYHPEVDGPIKLLRSHPIPEEPRLAAGELFTDKWRIVVGCGSGAVELLEVQLPGARAMSTSELLAGNRLEGRFSSGA